MFTRNYHDNGLHHSSWWTVFHRLFTLDVDHRFSETPSVSSFDPFLSSMLWFLAGWGFGDIFPHFLDWIDHILDALIKTFLRLFLLMPLLILGLFVQLFFEATIGPWKKPFIPVSTLLQIEHNG